MIGGKCGGGGDVVNSQYIASVIIVEDIYEWTVMSPMAADCTVVLAERRLPTSIMSLVGNG